LSYIVCEIPSAHRTHRSRREFQSQPCQRAAWRTHKPKCAINRAQNQRIGATGTNLLKSLRTFTGKHRPTISEVGVRALGVLGDPTRAERDVLLIALSPPPAAGLAARRNGVLGDGGERRSSFVLSHRGRDAGAAHACGRRQPTIGDGRRAFCGLGGHGERDHECCAGWISRGARQFGRGRSF
jgi:hypothetical protein